MQVSSCKPLYSSVSLHRPALGVRVPEIEIQPKILEFLEYLYIVISSAFSAFTFAVTDN